MRLPGRRQRFHTDKPQTFSRPALLHLHHERRRLFPTVALLQRADLRDCDQDTDDGTFEDGEAEDDDTEEHTTRTRTEAG